MELDKNALYFCLQIIRTSFWYDHAESREQSKSQNHLKVSGFCMFKSENAIDMFLQINFQKFVPYFWPIFAFFVETSELYVHVFHSDQNDTTLLREILLKNEH